MEQLTASLEPRPTADQYDARGFTLNGRTIYYPEPLQQAMAPSLFISEGAESGKLFLRWEVNGYLLSALQAGQQNQQGTVWDGPEGWWRKTPISRP